MPTELAAKVDAAASEACLSRSAFIRIALQEKFKAPSFEELRRQYVRRLLYATEKHRK